MRIFDTHCHFETTDIGEITSILSRARQAGVERILVVGGSPSLNEGVGAAVKANSTLVVGAVGFDRDQLGQKNELPKDLDRPLFTPVAWGEIGLDYYYSPETRQRQMELFASQLEEAKRRDLPVIIHTREAFEDTLALLKEIPSRGVIHCFTGTPEEAKAYLDLGFYISISGIVTFRAADNVRKSALVVPPERILIETDAPFLAPVPMRGKANEPAFIVHTCEFLAKLRGMDVEEFAALTYANGERAFS